MPSGIEPRSLPCSSRDEDPAPGTSDTGGPIRHHLSQPGAGGASHPRRVQRSTGPREIFDESPERSPIPEEEDSSLACECKEARQYEKKLLKRAAELERQAELAAKELISVRLWNKEELDLILMRQDAERMHLKDELEKCDILRTDLMRLNLGVMGGEIPQRQGHRD
ncbi:hypothetical protein GCK32_005346 [Trichostrongylus colubriformis]|uniref:Uncharacterized protein n=1 Tax=Trichostrongylus colubriformis TaxID=6319 RepID=A0AAN8IWG0_TRICO